MKLLRALLFWIPTWFFTIFMVCKTIYVAAKAKLSGRDINHDSHNVASQWGRGIIKMTQNWDFTIIGKEYLPKEGDRPVVIVANHQSSVDIWALYLLNIQFRWLSKAEVFKIPFLGAAMHLAGYVSVKRGDSESQATAFEQSRKWLKRGVSMVYFPEGSRSEDGQLKQFKTGAFRLSDLENVDILPMTIRGTIAMMKKNSYIPAPAHVELQLFPPTRRLENESLEDFVSRVRGTIGSALYTPRQTAPREAPIRNHALS